MSAKGKEITRRKFLARGVQTVAGIATTGTLTSYAVPKGRIIGANERINTAVIGLRGQGKHHIRQLGEKDNVCVKT